MIVVHHLSHGRAQRILWLLEELNVPYLVKKYQRLPNQKAPPALLDVHPLGKSPVIEDYDTEAEVRKGKPRVVLAESTAIINYLIQKYNPGMKSNLSAEGAIDDLYYTTYAESTFIPLIVTQRKLARFAGFAPWYLRPIFRYILGAFSEMYIDPEIPNNVKMIEDHLSENDWFARGSQGPTSADFAMIRGLEALTAAKIATLETCPAIVGYLQKAQARPAYQAAAQRGD
ncbi:hypothetical protein D9757_012723 [Collybiopsis confluens]|uniref:GST N-terminal domain-containing protein n=1 Tax=Collybiopsis confluens TaxID=2823264 RepID=A0A8H5CP06_9AGAR|nr:hypothetical protein D9757_013387 [Collybiopsis confluens]KAF5382343.1 hypothetical protein D9757_012723 [Collybiopsis confluens]